MAGGPLDVLSDGSELVGSIPLLELDVVACFTKLPIFFGHDAAVSHWKVLVVEIEETMIAVTGKIVQRFGSLKFLDLYKDLCC